MKKINIKKPSSFFVKSKSPRTYKNEERKSREIRKSLESYTNDWLEGRISDKDYKALKNDLYKRQEKIINTNYMKTFSVIMTEEELRLFSEFLEQREFKEQIKENPDYKRPGIIPVEGIKEHRDQVSNKRTSERLAEIEANEAMGAINTVLSHKKEDFHSLQPHNRMTKRWISEKDSYLQRLANSEGKNVIDQAKDTYTLGEEGLKVSGMLAAENKLNRIGYDNKYSAKGLERILGKKIDAGEAENIVKNRSVLADKYDKNSNGYIHKSEKGILDDLGRRWDDAKMVYGEALDGRSLGKDAAMTAGALAATGLAVHAIRKRRKNKKAQEAALNNKFRTSED